MENWSKVSNYQIANDGELGPWDNVSYDDAKVHAFIKRRFVNETKVSAGFDIAAALVCFIGFYEFIMLEKAVYLLAVLAVLALFFMTRFYANVNKVKAMYDILNNHRYQVCDCSAFDITSGEDGKFCHVKDAQGTVLMSRERENAKGKNSEFGEAVPYKLTYRGYFTYKDDEAKLLRVEGYEGDNYFFVFPVYYLKLDEKKH